MTTERTPTTEPTLDTIIAQLTTPFPTSDIQIKPGSVKAASALALAYADWRLYADRLDAVVGPAHWSIQLIPWGERRVIARLTILGISKDSTGEGDEGDPNAGTIAEAQAKKRACAEFGLGRYLYLLPRIWGKGMGDRRNFRFDEGETHRCVVEMYRRAGLPLDDATTATRATPPTIAVAPVTRTPPPPEKLAAARQALADAEAATRRPHLANASASAHTRTGVPATDAQLGLIVRLVQQMQQTDTTSSDAINSIGVAAVIATLTAHTRQTVHQAGLTKSRASTVIDQLQQLAEDVAHAA